MPETRDGKDQKQSIYAKGMGRVYHRVEFWSNSQSSNRTMQTITASSVTIVTCHHGKGQGAQITMYRILVLAI